MPQELTDAEAWGNAPVDLTQQRAIRPTDKPAPELGPGFYRDAGGNVFRNVADAPQQPAAPQEMSDQQAFGAPEPGPATASSGSLRPDEGLGFMKGFDRPLDNIATWAEQIPGVRGLDQSVASALGVANTDQAMAAHQQALADAAAQGRKPGALGEFAGSLPVGGAIGVATANPWLAGAAFGATNADKPLDIGNVAANAAGGAVLGKVGDMAVGALSHASSPKLSAMVQALQAEGVKLTPGQILGGTARRIEDGLNHLPVVGDMIKNAQATSIRTFNQAAINRSLAPIGEALPIGMTSGRGALDYAAGKLSGAYEDILPKLNMGLDDGFKQALAQGLAESKSLPTDKQTQFVSLLKNNVLNHFADDGSISGAGMQAADSKLGYLTRSYGRSLDPDQQALAHVLGSVQDGMRDMVARQNPDYADAINGVRTGWANLVRTEGAAANVGAKEGVFTPGQLAGAVKTADSSARHNAVAHGTALMQDLADAGQGVLPSTVPDSGTALRGLLEAGVVGMGAHEAGLLNPGTIAGATALAAPYTKPGLAAGRWLLGGDRPDWAKALAAGLSQYGKPAARIAAPASLPLLQALLQSPDYYAGAGQ